MAISVSIIIPTFNPNLTFLDELFKCFENFDKTVYEILLVDDGSRPETSNAIKDLCRLNNIQYLSYGTNKGVSFARNFGLKKATGTFVMFCDSDDIFDFRVLNSIDVTMLSENLYFFPCDFLENRTNELKDFKIREIDGSDSVFDYLKCPYIDENYISFRGSNAKLFKRSFLLENNIFFNEELKFCEDSPFVLQCLDYSKKVTIFYGNNLYYVRHNLGSSTSKWNNNFDSYFTNFHKYCYSIIKDDRLLYPVYRDTIAIYSKVRVCTSFKKLKICKGLNFLKLDCVKASSLAIGTYHISLNKEAEHFNNLLLKQKYLRAYFYLIKRQISHKITKKDF